MGDIQELSLKDWHRRFLQQATWTQDIRQHLFAKAQAQTGDKLLEVGSGTGAILEKITADCDYQLTGIDIDRPSLAFSKQVYKQFLLAQADGHQLPFADNTYSISVCHYLLLWVQHPAQILAEMRRVTKKGGLVMALAEPDHISRIDYPPPLKQLGEYQTQALQNQGADTKMGRKLNSLFNSAGLQAVETGILGAQWTAGKNQKIDNIEWMMIRSDLAGKLTEEEFSFYFQADRQSRLDGNRVLFIPTFYTVGIVP